MRHTHKEHVTSGYIGPVEKPNLIKSDEDLFLSYTFKYKQCCVQSRHSGTHEQKKKYILILFGGKMLLKVSLKIFSLRIIMNSGVS